MKTIDVIDRSDLKDPKVREMIRAPIIAIPTLILFIVCLSVLAVINYNALVGNIPLWLGMILDGLTIYFLFSPIHDASHGAFSRYKWINEIPGHLGMLFFGPVAPFNVARFIHMQHHRMTNDEVNDPDHYGHKMDLLFWLRWSNFDYFYTLYFFMRATPAMRKRLLPHLLTHFAVFFGVLIALFYFGYGTEAMMLWILPTRISSFLFTAAFVYLPHVPFESTAQKNEYRATNVRPGTEWLLTPILTFQNYHLMHHLYPSAPFYKMKKLWQLKYDHHQKHNALEVETFGFKPVPQSAKK